MFNHGDFRLDLSTDHGAENTRQRGFVEAVELVHTERSHFRNIESHTRLVGHPDACDGNTPAGTQTAELSKGSPYAAN